jgi:KTSC domain
MSIKMEPVTSSNITHVGYDKDAKLLHVQFKSGDKWEYSNVSHNAVADLVQAPSIGSHFAKHIKTSHPGVKL